MKGSSSREPMLFGLLGHEIGYSLSPSIHNAIFRKYGINARYTLFDVPSKGLSEAFRDLVTRTSGFNVTKPYKAEVYGMLENISPEAERCMNVNTVHNGTGYNTDYTAMRSLLAVSGVESSGKSATVFGSGPAASTAAVVLSELGFSVKIISRNSERARIILKNLERLGFGETCWQKFEPSGSISTGVAVNAISSADAVFPKIHCEAAVNLNYGTRGENFKRSIISNPHIVKGEDILLEQALESQKIWFGKKLSISPQEVFNGQQHR